MRTSGPRKQKRQTGTATHGPAAAYVVGSARRLEKLCGRDAPYRWLCGGVAVNCHALADFRTASDGMLDRLLSEGAAALMTEGLADLKRVAQDGMRVRACAGASSFRRRDTLERCLQEAQAQVKALKAELEAEPAAATRREHKACERAARERDERVRRDGQGYGERAQRVRDLLQARGRDTGRVLDPFYPKYTECLMAGACNKLQELTGIPWIQIMSAKDWA
ncbi:MAG: hypothetical protein GY851_20260 [bacterium]|nr:hypothetical protein [bacterium]